MNTEGTDLLRTCPRTFRRTMVRTVAEPSLYLDFTASNTLDPRITFTRATTATYFNSSGVLSTAASGEARFDYNPTTLAPLGLLIEEARTNSLLQSQNFTTTWTTTSQNASITSDTTTAPDGTLTADTITDDATSGIHRVSQSVTTSTTAQLVFSVFAKYNTMQWIGLSAATGTGTWAGAKFDIQNGVLGSTSQQGTGWTANSSSITPVGNGWYRCVLVFTPGASGSTTFLVNCATDGTTFTTSQRGSEVYSGTGSAAVIWGAQLETGAFPTSYIPTTTTALTRNADVASMTGTNFSSWYNTVEGTVVWEAQTAQGTNAYPWSVFGTNTQNRIFANYASSAKIESGVRTSNVFVALVASPNNSAPTNTFGKGATAYKVDDFGFSWNGAAALTDTSLTLPTVQELDIGNNGAITGNFLNGTIRRIAYYPVRLADTTLQALTA